MIFTSITEWYSNDTMILHGHVLMMNDQDAESERRLRNIYSPTSRSNFWSMAAIVGLTDNTCVGYYDWIYSNWDE